MTKRLTDLVAEALAKSETEEGRQELLEERKRLDAEARQTVQGDCRGCPSPGGGS